MTSQYYESPSSSEVDTECGEKDAFIPSDSRQSLRRNKTTHYSILAIIFLLIAIIATVLYVSPILITFYQHPSKNKGQWTDCGNDIDTALSRGCIFDMMGNNWVPPLCHDVSFAASAKSGNHSFSPLFGLPSGFPWYTTPNPADPEAATISDLEAYLTTKARIDEEITAYTTEPWHIAHCMYWLSSGVRAMNRLSRGERDVWVPRVVKKPEHAAHCSMITGHLFVEESIGVMDNETVMPKVFFGFATCVKLA